MKQETTPENNHENSDNETTKPVKKLRGFAARSPEERRRLASKGGSAPHMNTEDRGFAGMSAEKKREVARKAGRRAHELNVGHKWNANEAQKAGRVGGRKSKRGPARKKEED